MRFARIRNRYGSSFIVEGSHAARRQIEVHRQTETQGGAHRGGLRGSRGLDEGSRAAGLGHGEQDGQGRQKEGRIGPRQEDRQRPRQKRRQERGQGFGVPVESRQER